MINPAHKQNVGIRVQVNTRNLAMVRNHLGKIITTFNEEMSTATKAMAKDYLTGLTISAREQRLEWRGNLLEKMRIVKEGDKEYTIKMPGYGIALDSMRPHFAPTSSYPLGDWVKDKMRTGKKVPPVIWVKPHTWMEAGFKYARTRIEKRKEDAINKARNKR